MKKHIIQKLLHTIKCSKCGEPYEADNVDVIEHKNDKWFLSIYCPICQKQSFIIAIIKVDKQSDLNIDDFLND